MFTRPRMAPYVVYASGRRRRRQRSKPLLRAFNQLRMDIVQTLRVGEKKDRSKPGRGDVN